MTRTERQVPPPPLQIKNKCSHIDISANWNRIYKSNIFLLPELNRRVYGLSIDATAAVKSIFKRIYPRYFINWSGKGYVSAAALLSLFLDRKVDDGPAPSYRE